MDNFEYSDAGVTLFLMTEKGYIFLKDKVDEYKSLFSLVVVGADKSIQKDYEDEIIDLCVKSNINYVKRADFSEVKTEFVIAVSWRWLIKHPAEKLIVFHDSILPKYRGFAPLVNSLINGETQIGVSAIFGAESFDVGDIIFQSKTDISYPITISQAIDLNNENYSTCAAFVLNAIKNKEELFGVKQDESKASYSLWRDEDDYRIAWDKPATQIKRFIDAVGFPYKGASSLIGDKVVRIFNAEVCKDVSIENRDVGKVLFIDEGKPVIVCREGLLKIIDAYVDNQGHLTSLFPLDKFRIRFL